MTEKNKKDMIDSWKNPEARNEGDETPVGNIDLNEDDLDGVAGGAPAGGTYDILTFGCCEPDTCSCCE